MIIRYKKRALRDLERIHEYIAQFDSIAAKRVVERIEHSIIAMRALSPTAIAIFMLSAPAFATDPQVGRWAVDPRNCTGGGDTYRSAALTVTPRTLSWAAEYCTIGKMYKADRALYIEGRCSKGGLATTRPITLAMKGERLAVTWNGERSELRRCPGSY